MNAQEHAAEASRLLDKTRDSHGGPLIMTAHEVWVYVSAAQAHALTAIALELTREPEPIAWDDGEESALRAVGVPLDALDLFRRQLRWLAERQ